MTVNLHSKWRGKQSSEMLSNSWFVKMGNGPLGVLTIPLLNSFALLGCLFAHIWLHKRTKRFSFLSVLIPHFHAPDALPET